MDDIKKVALEYQKQNGNDKITHKNLLFYIISRLDQLEKEDSKQDERLAKVETRQGIFMWLGGILLAAIGLVISYLNSG